MEIDNLTVKDVKNKIKSIRMTYRFELNSILKASGAGAELFDKLIDFKNDTNLDVLPKENRENKVLKSY
nr:unnamed protein product [Callosobruchus chinensis]